MNDSDQRENTAQDRRKRGVFFVTDLGFLFATIVSALEVRRKTAVDTADVRIIMIDIPETIFADVYEYLAPTGIFLDRMPKHLFSGIDQNSYNKTHVPISTLGRFFMLDCVPDLYGRILYLDGDTWLSGNLDALLLADLPSGTIGAAEDHNFFRQDENGVTGRGIREYFANIGIDGKSGYFNAGVLLFDAETWRNLSKQAMEFFLENTKICWYHDQSALNAIVGSRRVRLSPVWNYSSLYFEWKLRLKEAPKIIHFVGGNKPWKIPGHPYHELYAETAANLPQLQSTFETWSGEKLLQYRKEARLKALKGRTIFFHRRGLRRKMFEKLVKESVL